jgi:toxin ParE1/3/4
MILKISPQAKDDLVKIKDYIAQELKNPQAASNLVSRITKRIRSLLEYPGIGASLSSIIDIQTDYRYLVCAHYLIFYKLENEIIYISRILYGGRDYMKILFGHIPYGKE